MPATARTNILRRSQLGQFEVENEDADADDVGHALDLEEIAVHDFRRLDCEADGYLFAYMP